MLRKLLVVYRNSAATSGIPILISYFVCDLNIPPYHFFEVLKAKQHLTAV